MLKYDSQHGQFKGTIEVKGNDLVVNGQTGMKKLRRFPKGLCVRLTSLSSQVLCRERSSQYPLERYRRILHR